MFTFLRAFCHGHLTSGVILREEKDFGSFNEPDYGDSKDIEHYYYYGESQEEMDKLTRPKKPILVMTNTITKDEIMDIPFFGLSYANKIVKSNPGLENELNSDNSSFLKFTRENHIEIVNDAPLKSIEEAIDYLISTRKLRSVLIEAGTTLTNRLYEEDYQNTPIEILVLSVYSGKIDKSCIGKEFSSFAKINKQFTLAHKTEPMKSAQGYLIIYTFLKVPPI